MSTLYARRGDTVELNFALPIVEDGTTSLFLVTYPRTLERYLEYAIQSNPPGYRTTLNAGQILNGLLLGYSLPFPSLGFGMGAIGTSLLQMHDVDGTIESLYEDKSFASAPTFELIVDVGSETARGVGFFPSKITVTVAPQSTEEPDSIVLARASSFTTSKATGAKTALNWKKQYQQANEVVLSDGEVYDVTFFGDGIPTEGKATSMLQIPASETAGWVPGTYSAHVQILSPSGVVSTFPAPGDADFIFVVEE